MKEGKQVIDPKEISTLREHFQTHFHDKNVKGVPLLTSQRRRLTKRITSEKVTSALNNNRAAGPDGISADIHHKGMASAGYSSTSTLTKALGELDLKQKEMNSRSQIYRKMKSMPMTQKSRKRETARSMRAIRSTLLLKEAIAIQKAGEM